MVQILGIEVTTSAPSDIKQLQTTLDTINATPDGQALLSAIAKNRTQITIKNQYAVFDPFGNQLQLNSNDLDVDTVLPLLREARSEAMVTDIFTEVAAKNNTVVTKDGLVGTGNVMNPSDVLIDAIMNNPDLQTKEGLEGLLAEMKKRGKNSSTKNLIN